MLYSCICNVHKINKDCFYNNSTTRQVILFKKEIQIMPFNFFLFIDYKPKLMKEKSFNDLETFYKKCLCKTRLGTSTKKVQRQNKKQSA